MMQGGYALHLDEIYEKLIHSLECIGWRRTMEGMLSKEIFALDAADILLPHSKHTIASWAQGLIIKLLEATHGMWIYRNLVMHDSTAGWMITREKEQIA